MTRGLEVERRRKGELGEDVRNHVGGRTPHDGDRALLDEVADVVVFDVDVFRLRGGHVGGEGDATPVVFEGRCRAFDRASKGRKGLVEEHGFL